MAYYDALIAKWATLSGTTAQKLAAINALTVPGPPNPLIIPTYRLFNAIDQTEYNSAALATARPRIVELLGMGQIDASSGTPTRTMLTTIFSAANAPISRAAIIALANSIENTTLPWWQATVAQGGGGYSQPIGTADLTLAGGLT